MRRARSEISAAIEAALQAVESLDEDRILRHFVNAVAAAIRTDSYPARLATVAPKNSSPSSLQAAASRPHAAAPASGGDLGLFAAGGSRCICVSAGLRAAASAGRTGAGFPQRVLGLMKAQMVKNAVIVPVGAKGGFVRKSPAGGPREAIQAEGIASYKMLSRPARHHRQIGAGALAYSAGRVVRLEGTIPIWWSPPTKARRHSPTSPTISLLHDFWLGDAFASGGSAGYDHKKMGITARGAWESVKRHFRETGYRHRSQAVLGGGCRRHVGRRLRQRHAAREDDKLARRLQPQRYLHRSRPRPGTDIRRTPADVRPAALGLAGFRQG